MIDARPTITQRVTAIVAERFGKRPDELAPETTFSTLGLDDMDVMELGFELELEFGIVIDFEPDDNINTVADAIAYIERRVKP